MRVMHRWWRNPKALERAAERKVEAELASIDVSALAREMVEEELARGPLTASYARAMAGAWEKTFREPMPLDLRMQLVS